MLLSLQSAGSEGFGSFSSQLWDTTTAPGAAPTTIPYILPPFQGFLTCKLLFVGISRGRLHFGSREPQHPSLVKWNLFQEISRNFTPGKWDKNIRWAQNPSQEGELGAEPTQDGAPWWGWTVRDPCQGIPAFPAPLEAPAQHSLEFALPEYWDSLFPARCWKNQHRPNLVLHLRTALGENLRNGISEGIQPG